MFNRIRLGFRETPKLPLISEYLFIILPFIVWVVSKFATGKLVVGELIYIKDWSFAAAILSGQTLIKLTGGFSVAGKNVISIDKIILITTLLIVFILLPAVIILAYVAGGSEAIATAPGAVNTGDSQPLMHANLAGSQITLFCGATVAYYLLGGWGMYLQKKYAELQTTNTPSGDAANSESIRSR